MRKGLFALLVIALIGLSYYLFIRPFEFEANFKAKTLPGDVIETIRIWNRSLDSARITEVDSFRSLKQTIVDKNRSYNYDWYFSTISDSVTKVNVRISEPGNRFLNKLLVPFTQQPVEVDAGEMIGNFYDVLKVHLKITRVKIKGEAEIDSLFCVCSTLETDQIEKANGMMKDYLPLTTFISNFDLQVKGPPIVKIQEWNHNRGVLKFNFCFPILPSDSLPFAGQFRYKQFQKERVLKAEYYGNYITSDRAWYELIHYAAKNGYKINGLPIEFFHNNPNLGINESEWKAEVYLPIE